MKPMSRTIITLIAITLTSLQNVSSQVIEFVDPAFKQAVLNHDSIIDSNQDGLIQTSEAFGVKKLNLMNKGITSIEYIYHFPNIIEFLATNNSIQEVALSGLEKLETFYCARNKITKLEITNLPSLKELAIGLNQLTEITLNDLPNLESLNCMHNQLESIELSKFKKLKYLSVDHNKLKKLIISENTELIQIIVNDNELKEIDIRKNLNLKVNIMYADDDVKIIRNETQTAPKAVPPPPMSMPSSSNKPIIDSIVVSCRYEQLFDLRKEEIIQVSAKNKNWSSETIAEVRSKIVFTHFQNFMYYNAYSSESEKELLELLKDCNATKNDPIMKDLTVFKSIVLSNYDNYLRSVCDKYK
jgi:Leucine-rich repeat (LRR) protein